MTHLAIILAYVAAAAIGLVIVPRLIRLWEDARRYRFLIEHCSTYYPMYTGSEPSPAEAHLEWGWQQHTQRGFRGFDMELDEYRKWKLKDLKG